MQKPTDILMHEHKVILLVLDAVDREVAYIGKTGKIHSRRVREMADFFRTFVDRCHHAKEEKHLLAMMNRRGMPLEHGPLARVVQEHEEGRACVRAIADAVAGKGQPGAAAIARAKKNLAAYARLLRKHIDKEDTLLYPKANELFKPADQRALAAAFDKVETEEMGEGVHEKYHAWVETLIHP